MYRSHFAWVFGLLTILGLASLGMSQELIAPQPLQPALQDPIEVQTRGLLHEAFAQPLDVQPAPGELVPKEPPPAIPEEPPEQKPAADNVQWIPGYWSWDSERRDYVWISGVYRVPPQGRTFVPGYWSNTPDGWRWIAGFWSDANQQEIPYTPEPPAPLNSEPSMPAPDDSSMYVPGTWVYRTDRFLWRPGYWAAFQTGRVWVPPHYVWTPNGYLFIDGYWDYPLDDRGIAFAPVYFSQPLWRDANWRYRPHFALSLGAFFDSAFVGRNGFYFGNYYDPSYARSGIRPWYDGRGRYDPAFAYHGWQNHGGNANWVAGAQQTYANRSAGRAARPPLTLAAQSAQKGATPVVVPLNQFTSRQVNLVRATPTQIETQRTFATQTRKLAEQRSKLEAPTARSSASQTRPTGETRSFRLPTGSESKNAPQVLTFPSANKSSGPTIHQGTRSIPTPSTKVAPSIVTPTPRVVTPAPRVVTPPTPTPRVVPSAPPAPPRVTPTPIRKTSVNVAPRIVSNPAPQFRPAAPAPARVSAPAPARVSAPAPARVSAPARPAPARSNPPPRPANNRKR